MADIRSINMGDHEIIVDLKISNSEYELLKNNRYDLVLLPSDFGSLCNTLTTGRLGNSNRIMIPKKMLAKERVELQKRVPSRVFKINDTTYLLIKLNESSKGIPVFDDGKEEVKK
jgi:hypothetical protein